MFAFIKEAPAVLKKFSREEDGLALTEYLILLGLLTAAVIAAVIVFGEQLGAKWGEWAVWLGGAALSPDQATIDAAVAALNGSIGG
jgi:pilus assembly protein Flp/PilA